jgi:hypothetical protein
MVDYRGIVHAAIHAAIDDAWPRMCQEAMAGRSIDWRVYVRPALDKDTPAPLYIGPRAPGPEYMRVQRLTVDGTAEKHQLFNALRDRMDTVPLFAMSFRDSAGCLTDTASLALELDT